GASRRIDPGRTPVTRTTQRPIGSSPSPGEQSQQPQQRRHRQPLHHHREGHHGERRGNDFVAPRQRRRQRQCQGQGQRAAQTTPPQHMLSAHGNSPVRPRKYQAQRIHRDRPPQQHQPHADRESGRSQTSHRQVRNRKPDEQEHQR